MKKQGSKINVRDGTKYRTVPEKFVFRLFITGALPNSVNAVINGKAFCEKYLKGRYTLQVIDIYQQPALASSENIIAVPVLIKKLPLPEERLTGDLSDTDLMLKIFHLGN